jgi:hypothetical protein
MDIGVRPHVWSSFNVFNVCLSSRRWFVLCLVYISYPVLVLVSTRVEVGSNTSTVTLRVVGGDEKGSLNYETVKYGHESYGNLTSK